MWQRKPTQLRARKGKGKRKGVESLCLLQGHVPVANSTSTSLHLLKIPSLPIVPAKEPNPYHTDLWRILVHSSSPVLYHKCHGSSEWSIKETQRHFCCGLAEVEACVSSFLFL
jgi:hypothetical protein